MIFKNIICKSLITLMIVFHFSSFSAFANTITENEDEVNINITNTALVLTDPQNDFLSENGVAWDLVSKNVMENNTINNIKRLLIAAKKSGMNIFVSPHYYYPTDYKWKFEGKLEKIMHESKMFYRKGPLTLEGFEGSGADWLDIYKPIINDGKTIITSPHKVYGPQANDLVLQLRKNGIDKVILAGMSANLCVESHMRELIEQGFEVIVVKDATAAATLDGMDGYSAALTNFNFIANAVWSTDEAESNILKVK